jgi:hypothetical protein
MKIMLLAAATLSLRVGTADADNAEADNKGDANTQYTQTIREAAPTSHPEVPPPPVIPVVPPKGRQQDRQLILLY